MGDPAGVGPETIAAAWPSLTTICRPLVVGHPEVMRRAVNLGVQDLTVQTVERDEWNADVEHGPSTLPCLMATASDAADVPPRVVDPRGGQAAYDALQAAIRLALDGAVDAITTAPLNKAALALAGREEPGHTEILADACGVSDFAMMLYLPPSESVAGPAGLGAVHATLHQSLREAVSSLDEKQITSVIRLAAGAMQLLKGDAARVGVCALNPHAGEGGLMGNEEQTIIRPAVEAAREFGIDIEGPLPADSLWSQARDGEYDAVVCMYHDQGHVPLKLLDMHGAVNVTLGLPIVRTSVAHGTAFDLAWQGVANERSTIEAVRVATQLVGLRRPSAELR